MQDLVTDRVPWAVRDAIALRNRKLVVLHEFDHPDGMVRGWTGTGLLKYSGNSWYGFGDLVSVDGIGGSRKTEVRVVTVTLSGVNPNQLQFITRKVRGRRGRLSLAALRPGTRAIEGDVYSLCYATADSQDHKIETGHAASIVLTFNQPLFILDRAPNLAWTPDWLKATYGDDITGLDDLPGVAARIESWTPAT